MVEHGTDEKYQNEADKKDRKDSRLVVYEEKKTLVYIRFSRIHPEYQDRHQKQRGKTGLDIQALQYELRQPMKAKSGARSRIVVMCLI